MSKNPSGSSRPARSTQPRKITEEDRDKEYPLFSASDLDKEFAKQRLTENQSSSLNSYQGVYFKYINNYLRNGTVPDHLKAADIQRRIDDIDSINWSLPANMTLQRKVGSNIGFLNSSDVNRKANASFVNSFFEAHANGVLTGSRFKDSAFVSTSAGSRNFGAGIPGSSQQIIFKIRAKKGTKAAIPSRDSFLADENEILLTKGSTFRVVGSRYGANDFTLIVDLDLE